MMLLKQAGTGIVQQLLLQPPNMAKESGQKKRIRNPVQTRSKLLQATIDLVTEKGSDALSLKEAAKRANVSRGVAYLHFHDRDHLLNEAKHWIANRLRDGVKKFDGASMHDRTLHTTKVVLENPEASKLMIVSALSGKELDRNGGLYKLVSKMLTELKSTGKVRPDFDPEIITYIMFGSIAATLMLGEQHKGGNTDALAERFTNEWNRVLQEGIFVKGKAPKAAPSRTPAKRRAKSKKTRLNQRDPKA